MNFMRHVRIIRTFAGKKKKRLRHNTAAHRLQPIFVFFTLALSSVLPGGAPAHVGADSMPDSVAETEYLIYLEFKPGDTVVRNKLGMVYYRLGKLEQAAGEFAMILRKDPDNYDALDGMGLAKAAQQKYDEAVRYHRQAISVNPDDMMVHYHLGCALENKGLPGEAAAAYQAALAEYREKYPAGTEEKQAVEFLEKVRNAINTLEHKP